ncbi:DNA translocase FtsK [Zhenpiania hominis]|nr:DNA translocase FtsK [Zhenpiania hominis]
MTEKKRNPGKAAGSKKKNTGSRRQAASQKKAMDPNLRDEIWAILIIALGAFLAVAFQTHAAGAVGEALSDFFKGCLGAIAYAFPYYLILYGILLFAKKTIHIGRKALFLLFIILLMAAFLNSARFLDPQVLGFGLPDAVDYYHDGILLDSGGLLGMYIGSLIVKAFGIPGLYMIAVVVIIICLLLIINTPVSRFTERAAEKRRAKKEAELDEELEESLPSEPVSKGKTTPILMDSTDRSALAEREKRRVPLWERLKREQSKSQEETSYTPGRISSGQKQILAYMENDDLFGGEAPAASGYGLSDEPPQTDGYGMQQSFGLDGHVPEPEPGKGLIEEGSHSAGRSDLEPEDDLSQEISEKTSAAVIAAKAYEPEKMTKSQAAKASLSPEEISENSHPIADYRFPPMDLLNKPKLRKDRTGSSELRAKAMKLEETLHNFRIDAEVVQVTQGPTVTRYEIHPNVGVKVKSIVNLADDIALNLEAKSIRIEAPIPGKAAVGIEVENDKVNMVTIREMIDSPEFKQAESKITFAVGKNIEGKAIVADLKGMPHLLIAGSTGSGKSVCVNSIITSILYKARPEEVKLVLIDPKVVELANYNEIPHLLIPVVTDPPKAAAALNWAVAEMEKRYKKFAEEGVRDLAGYNELVTERGEEDSFLPQVVIIIDELADLMMAAPSQVEESICRLAQKARAAGMHLIVATQRPSVDVITGVIKANIPSRIAFAVSSQFDSRTILDMAGAEKLVGKGDMLFSPIGSGKPMRVQGPFISDQEVHKVIEFVKSQVEKAEYSEDVIETIDKGGIQEAPDDADELLPDAIEMVVAEGGASVSMLQRRFRVGYNRAARIVEQMEARGIVGPADGSKKRQVLMTEEELAALRKETEDLKEG